MKAKPKRQDNRHQMSIDTEAHKLLKAYCKALAPEGLPPASASVAIKKLLGTK